MFLSHKRKLKCLFLIFLVLLVLGKFVKNDVETKPRRAEVSADESHHGARVSAKVKEKKQRIWPIPHQVNVSGSPYPISEAFSINTLSKSVILSRGITRYLRYFTKSLSQNTNSAINNAVNLVVIKVAKEDETLGMDTIYQCEIIFKATNVVYINAESPFGALYGLETLYQLVEDGAFMYSNIHIVDKPAYIHRGLMLDTGRRFIPLDVLYNILDGMSFVKMNVLHLHFSDVCRFSIESKLYPELRNNEQQIYSQEDIKNLVVYAQDRGIRVVPELESASHSNGLVGINKRNRNVFFCEDKKAMLGYLELYNDPKGVTVATMARLINEMMSLFPDQLFHLGLDEIFDTMPPCTLKAMQSLETALLKHVEYRKKTTVAWEEAFTWTETVLPSTIIQAWKSTSIKSMVQKKYKVINSLSKNFYLDILKVTPEQLWNNMSQGLTAEEQKYVIGGEMAMWTDKYCYIYQCYFQSQPKPSAWWMYQQEQEVQFVQSLTGLIWPRSIAGAGSFWNYRDDIKPDTDEFNAYFEAAHKRLLERHVLSCPLGCKCDYLTRCGKPYPKFDAGRANHPNYMK